MSHRQTDTLIVGGGLAGLCLADLLAQTGRDLLLVEARDRLGGRILSHRVEEAAYDLGPAWFWPGQPRMAALAARFHLPVFEQFAQGDFRYEDPTGRIQQGRGAGSMQGSLRLAGGMQALTDALASTLPAARILTGQAVTGLTCTPSSVTAALTDGTRVLARRVVLALPPRIAATLTFSPALPAAARDAMAATPTWMAGQAKAVLLYDRPFWRDAGLSGDAMSHRGPMVEIHDASPASGGPPALFGFIGLPATQRMDAAALRAGVAAQAARLFGPDAPDPREILLKDWARDPATAVPADADPLTAHPRYGLPQALRILWDGALLLANTEVAAEFGGYLEGALVAAETAYGVIAPRARSA